VKTKWRRMTGKDAFCCLSFYVSRRRTTSQFCPPPSHHSQISPSLPPSLFSHPPSFLSFNPVPVHLTVIAFHRSPSRIPPPLRRRCSCLPASTVPEAAAGSCGGSRARRLRWVGGFAGWLLPPDPSGPRIRLKDRAFVGFPRHAGGFGASAVRRGGPLV
jgi:hypothetical protein